jgi:molybdate transport system substrate-binding protein
VNSITRKKENDVQLNRRRLLGWGLAVATGIGAIAGAPLSVASAEAGNVVVFAAASLKNALDDINTQWQKETGKKAAISYGASSVLAKQIEAAAPADIFVSADIAWMDDVAKKGLIKPETRKDLLGNEIVLVAPKDSPVEAKIEPNFPLAKLLGDGRLAMANTDSVPAGKYGKAALQALGVWDSVSAKVAQAEDVRAALALVSRGEAPLGIVYQTDVAADPNVRIVATFPKDTHPPIIYPIALVASSTNPDAAAFLDYIKSAAAKPLFEKQGFVVLP